MPSAVGVHRYSLTPFRWIARCTLAAAVGLLLLIPSVASASTDTAFAISGRGWGHGIGMSQWGAYGLAKHGSDYKDILRHYYTGVAFAKLDNPTIRVQLRNSLAAVRITSTKPYAVTVGNRRYEFPAGVTATTTVAGEKYRVSTGDWTRDFSSPVTFMPGDDPLKLITATDLGTTGGFRGTIQIVRSGQTLAMINHVPLESYLRGVVPLEVSPDWPGETLKAQVCAARSYAERARRSSGSTWDVYCDVRSQVYGGVSREDPRTDAAVAATIGVVPTYKGEPIQAFYFSCSGGETENIEMAWETIAQPYLKSVEDPYDAYAPLHEWGPLRRTRTQLTTPLGTLVKGTLQAIYPVEYGMSPRIVKAAIIGSSGTTYIHGSALRMKLGLNSAWAVFTSMSIAPAAKDATQVRVGSTVKLTGRIYPALAAGTTVRLMYKSEGTWRSKRVSTIRKSRGLSEGYSARYSLYTVAVTPETTTRYYFMSGTAKSPTTTITVTE
ncbi:MAG: SpoIID/LytB domain-containing protein [Thermoleophilia bacterium]